MTASSKPLPYKPIAPSKQPIGPPAAPVLNTLNYSDETQFFIEDQASTIDDVLQHSGDYLQVFPARPALLMIETAAGQFDEHSMPESGGRGGANKHCTNAIIVGQSSAGVEFRVQRDGKWQQETIVKPLRQQKAWLDGKILPNPAYALKPGRRCWLATYRGKDTLMILYVSTHKGEIDGTISAIDGNTLTLSGSEINPSAEDQIITLPEDMRVLIDGQEGSSAGLELGQYVRFFSTRQQSIVALRQWVSNENGDYQPVAAFRSEEMVLGTQTVAFDASSSYGHGQEIASYSWDFGDGNSASGPQVSHTFSDSAYGNHTVTLTVTDATGASDQVQQQVAVAPALLPAQSVENLQDGYRYEFWSESMRKIKDPAQISEFVTTTVASEPAMSIGMEQFEFERKEKRPGADRKPGIRRLSGYLNVPEDGWYAFAVIGNQQVWIDGHPLFDFTGSLKQTYVPLQAGMHRFEHIGDTQDNYLNLSWMHPDGRRVLPAGTSDGDFTGTTRWQCYFPLKGSLFYQP